MRGKSSGGRRRRIAHIFVGFIVLAIIGGLTINYLRPLPILHATVTTLPNLSTEPVSIAWSGVGQAAIGASNFGVLAAQNASTPLATASIAKVITVLCVLQKYPLNTGQDGPTITMTSKDVQIYNDYVAKNGSVVPIQVGEQLSEYQILQALLLPSANNLADSVAVWAFGSLSGYATYANTFLSSNGLSMTHVGNDASGYDPSTTSTASDLVKLGLLAVKNAVVTEIASQKSTSLPIAGVVRNYNFVLGQKGINGLKTGNNDQDPGAFLFSAVVPVGTTTMTVIGAVMGQSNLAAALSTSLPLIDSLQAGFKQEHIIERGQIVAKYHAAWGATVDVVADNSLLVPRWKATAGTVKQKVNDISSSVTGTVGTVDVMVAGNDTNSTLSIKHAITPPSFWWRITRH